MTIKNWKIFNTFKKRKTEDDVIFFPNSQDVFAEKDMEIYFSPLLTYKYKLNNKEYKIHLITTAGLICENDYLNSENRFFGFKYNNGKYEFLGNIHTFGNSEIKEVYSFLRADFENNKDYYLLQKVSLSDYVKMVKPLARKAGNFTERQSLGNYIENFYSYEMEKYNYQKTGKIMHLFEITESIFREKKHLFYNTEETKKITLNFLDVLGNDFQTRYNLEKAEPICAADTFCFSNFSSTAVTFFNPEKSLIYTFEYND